MEHFIIFKREGFYSGMPNIEVLPDGRLVAAARVQTWAEYEPVGDCVAFLSEDGGVTWTDPLSTGVHGWPAHLLKLHDGRILCAYGRRMEPGGVRAALSEDGGQTWDLDNEVVLRDDAGYASSLKGGFSWRADVGYPVSVQLPDDNILTAYYITESDGITHTAVTRWKP